MVITDFIVYFSSFEIIKVCLWDLLAFVCLFVSLNFFVSFASHDLSKKWRLFLPKFVFVMLTAGGYQGTIRQTSDLRSDSPDVQHKRSSFANESKCQQIYSSYRIS
jgi:hypothetical protein